MRFMYEEENTGVYMWSSDHRKREKREERDTGETTAKVAS